MFLSSLQGVPDRSAHPRDTAAFLLQGTSSWTPELIFARVNAVLDTLESQTRLWGYNVGRAKQEQELNKILVESSLPVKDPLLRSQVGRATPVRKQRLATRFAEFRP